MHFNIGVHDSTMPGQQTGTLHHMCNPWGWSPVDVLIRKQIGYFFFLSQGKIPTETAGLGVGQQKISTQSPEVGRSLSHFRTSVFLRVGVGVGGSVPAFPHCHNLHLGG